MNKQKIASFCHLIIVIITRYNYFLIILVPSTSNITCFWGGKICAKWTNQIVTKQGCDDPELGHLRKDDFYNLKFCVPRKFSWFKLGSRNIGYTKLIATEKRQIW